MLFSIVAAASLTSPIACSHPSQAIEPERQEGADVVAPDPWQGLNARLVQLMRDGIGVREPHRTALIDVEGESPFGGSYDWHSCVIAHWALLNHARVSDDDELEEWVTARLSLDALEAEEQRLSARAATFGAEDLDRRQRAAQGTFPYDEGWFNVLLSELDRRDQGDDEDRMTALRLRVEKRLISTLESSEFPENLGVRKKQKERGVERYCGFYRSLLFTYLQLRWSDPITEGAAERLDRWRSETLEPKRGAIAAVEKSFGYDFLWVPALLALADDVDGVSAGEPYAPPAFEGWPDSVKITSVHIIGLELCRAWPLAAAPESNDDYRAHVGTLLGREDLWLDDFSVSSHWLPQYLYIGEWLRASRP